MEITDGVLRRLDAAHTPMPTDEHGLLTEVADARMVLHELAQDFGKMLALPVPVAGFSLLDALLLSNPVTTMMLIETLNAVHEATCPHKAEVEGAVVVNDVDGLMKQIMGIIASIPEDTTPEGE